MAIAIDPRGVFDYVLAEDRGLPEEARTVWELSALSSAQESDVADHMYEHDPVTGQMRLCLGKKLTRILQAGLRGVRNFRDEEGKEVRLERDKQGRIPADFLDRLLPAWRTELANAITERGRPSVAEGNS